MMVMSLRFFTAAELPPDGKENVEGWKDNGNFMKAPSSDSYIFIHSFNIYAFIRNFILFLSPLSLYIKVM